MPRISQYVEAPLNGISQAEPQVRLKNQAEDLFNCTVEIPDGLRKRPPMNHRGVILPGVTLGSDFHRTAIPSTNRGEPDTYWIVGADKVSRLVNSETRAVIAHTVSASAQAYLNALISPIEDIRTVTVEDYTFIANRRVPIVADPDLSPTRPFEALVWLKLSDYGRRYTLTIAGLSTTALTPDGGAASDSPFIDTSRIMDILLNGGTMPGRPATTALGPQLTTAGFTWSLQGSILFLSRATDFTVTTADGMGSTGLVPIKGSTARISDLPSIATDGFTIRITGGSSGANNDDTFVRFEASGAGGGGVTGVWKETIAPGASYGLDSASLPIGLRYDQALNSWSLDILPWGPREVGDEELAPDPLTPGTFIQDIGWFRSRLRLIGSDDIILYAGAANPFRLYPSTLTTLVDSDPVQLTNPGEERAFFNSGRTFDQRDVIFGSKAQAVVSSEGPFTLKTARVDVLAEYPFAGVLPLVKASDNIHFTMVKGDQYDGIWELSINGQLQRTEGEDLTAAQPRLLPAGLNRYGTLKGSYATLYARHGEPNLFMHLYRYAGQERIQSGFFRWGVPAGWTVGDILSGAATKLTLGLLDPDGILHDVEIDMASKLKDSVTSTILTTLDLRVTENQCVVSYNAGTDTTTYLTPYPLAGDIAVSVRGDGQEAPEGMLLTATDWNVSGVTLQGDTRGLDVYLGVPYDSWWDLSEIAHYGADDRVLVDGGDMNLRQVTFSLGKSAYMAAQVKVGQRPLRTYQTPQTNFDEPSLFKGPWVVSTPGKNSDTTIRLRNDSHLQGYALGFTWVAEHNLRSQSQG